MSRIKFSRLTIPRRANDESVLGLLVLHDPLGFESIGHDLVAFFRDARAARGAAARLAAARVRHRLITDIPEGDALELYRAASRPFRVGRRFWIEPGDPTEAPPPPDRIALRVPASTAFGTGEHASTRLALLALEDEPIEGERVLDVGTGSGILALAAAALGASRVVAFDRDLDAAIVARENVRRHRFAGRVRIFAGAPPACSGRFELVVANLLASELLPEARRLLGLAVPRGRAIFSGITSEREGEVLARLRARSWTLAARRAEGEWVCLCMARG